MVKSEKQTEKKRKMEKESNVTLISASIAVLSFFVLLYAQGIVKTNFLEADVSLTVIEGIYAISAIVGMAFAIFKRAKWLWEYVIFALLMAVGYYFLHHPGVSGLPFLYTETETSLKISDTALKLSSLITASHVIYALWTVIVLYCVFFIALHQVRYNKIKNNNQK